MAKKRAFVSFDYDNDKVLKDFIIGQAKLPDSPFEVVDTSIKEAQPMKTWEEKARAAAVSPTHRRRHLFDRCGVPGHCPGCP